MFLDELSVALRKANKAKYTSDLSSQNDELKTRRPSKREKKKTVEKNKSIRHSSEVNLLICHGQNQILIFIPVQAALTNGKYLFFLNNKIVFFIIINFTILLDKNLVQNPTETATTSTTEIPKK